ncbi:hypothetical protein ACJRO7_021291 [Eucalyptus globulus]|uniref:TIR domain-containing protein n=1 Tax=Eucalyptus globulus TaxID=34317 RepID=A0ABD3KJA7_EUCGL
MSFQIFVYNYQVFLSFRGPDVRDNFLECFHNHLKGAGIVAFLDRKEIKYGERIDDKIVEAIKCSYICIPVFSEDFASIPAYLMEVAQMVESNKTILPIFYGVEPSVVRYQRGTYGNSFAEHECKNRYLDSIEKWKAALGKIAGKMGPTFKNVNGGYLECVKDFVSKLQKLLRMDEQDVTENLVGTDKDVLEMMRKLGFYEDGQVVKEREMTGRRLLVVWSLPVVGKTTLTKVLYSKISHLFEGCSFLENVREEIEEKRVVSLKNRLIRDHKRGEDSSTVESPNQGTKMIRQLFKESIVLIVLDDVDNFEQIKPLVELTWFGPDHEILPLNENHALELFRKCAFGQNHPLKNNDKMSREIISAVGNLPFAIDIDGRYLNVKNENIRRRTLDDLKGELQEKVERMLEACYKLLGKKAREIFLDLACFFTGVEKTMPFYMWAARKLGPNIRVDELQNMSFLKTGEKNEFLMHCQLKFLGREIVKKEDEYPRQWSKVWNYEDVQTTLCKKKGASKVKAFPKTRDFIQVNGEVFHHLSNLRFLKLDNVDIDGNPENLLPNLVWLDWHGCHDKYKLFAFKMEKLKSNSNFENLVSLNKKRCKLFKHLPQALCSMKALKDLLIDGTKIQRLHFNGRAVVMRRSCGLHAAVVRRLCGSVWRSMSKKKK